MPKGGGGSTIYTLKLTTLVTNDGQYGQFRVVDFNALQFWDGATDPDNVNLGGIDYGQCGQVNYLFTGTGSFSLDPDGINWSIDVTTYGSALYDGVSPPCEYFDYLVAWVAAYNGLGRVEGAVDYTVQIDENIYPTTPASHFATIEKIITLTNVTVALKPKPIQFVTCDSLTPAGNLGTLLDYINGGFEK